MELKYEFTVGKKLTSSLLYTSDKQLFRIKNKNGTGDHYQCYIESCSAKVVITNNKCFYETSHMHLHAHQQATYNLFKLDAAMKRRCINEKKRPREIFNEECSQHEDVSGGVQFEKRRRHYNRIQSRRVPANPKTMDDVQCYLMNETVTDVIDMLHWKTVSRRSFGYTIFASSSILNDLPTTRRFRIDGTFKCVPRGPFKQLLIISVDVVDNTFPCFYVLMTRKTKVSYIHLLKTIEQEWNLNPTSLTTDYEKGLRTSLRLVYPNAKLLGCWFHFCQCIRRKVLSLDHLSSLIKSNTGARKLYRKFLYLPLIRSDCIEEAFGHLRVEAHTFGDAFKKFLEYFRSQWIENEGVESLTLFLEFHRTNNLSESYNSDLNEKLDSHGCMFKFLEVIKSEESVKSRDFRIAKLGGTQMYPQKRTRFVDRDNYISKVQLDFSNGKITIENFFNEIIKCSELDKNDDGSLNAEKENNNKLCVVCLKSDKDTMVEPCCHTKFCFKCIKALHHDRKNVRTRSGKPKCPICGVPIDNYKRVNL